MARDEEDIDDLDSEERGEEEVEDTPPAAEAGKKSEEKKPSKLEILAKKAAGKEITKAQKKALFEAYGKERDAYDAALVAAEAARKKMDLSVEAIISNCGKGPFKFQGVVLRPMCRGEVVYFRGEGRREVEEIG